MLSLTFLFANIFISVASVALFYTLGGFFKDFSTIVAILFAIGIFILFPNTFDGSILILSTLTINVLYSKNSFPFIFIFSLLIISEGVINFSASNLVHEILSIGLGISISLLLSNSVRIMSMNNETQKGGNHRTEVHRDIVQIITGVIIIIAIVYIQKVLVEGGLMLGIILGIILVDIAGIYKNSSVSKVILHFERHNVQPGLGTLWFIAGLMILIAFTERWRIIEIGVFAMAIGDSLATIGGVNIKSMKLFYNKKKSVGGFFCMLIPTAVFAYLILGPIFIILAVIATFAESVSRYPVDDNISIPISVILSRFIFSLI